MAFITFMAGGFLVLLVDFIAFMAGGMVELAGSWHLGRDRRVSCRPDRSSYAMNVNNEANLTKISRRSSWHPQICSKTKNEFSRAQNPPGLTSDRPWFAVRHELSRPQNEPELTVQCTCITFYLQTFGCRALGNTSGKKIFI